MSVHTCILYCVYYTVYTILCAHVFISLSAMITPNLHHGNHDHTQYCYMYYSVYYTLTLSVSCNQAYNLIFKHIIKHERYCTVRNDLTEWVCVCVYH